MKTHICGEQPEILSPQIQAPQMGNADEQIDGEDLASGGFLEETQALRT